MRQSALEHALAQQLYLLCNAYDWPTPEQEFRFHPVRRWRFDFAFPDLMIAIEAEGGVYSQGRHVRGTGFEADCEKYNTATLMGWSVLRFTKKTIESGEAAIMIEKLVRHTLLHQSTTPNSEETPHDG